MGVAGSSTTSTGAGGDGHGGTPGHGGAGAASPGSQGAGGMSGTMTGGGGAPCAVVCGENAHCEEGVCVCDAGFTGDGQACGDIDECKEQPDACHASALCTDTDGSFSCVCPPGTEGDPSFAGVGCEARYTAVVAGQLHTCARRKDGSTMCFGNGSSGRLGNGSSTNRNVPVQAGAASNWLSLASNDAHTCGIKTSGNLWCWGANSFGQLGTGNTEQQTLPAYHSLVTKWSDVAVGANHSCAIREDGALLCWGRNTSGQLGIGSTASPQLAPMVVNVVVNVTPEGDWKRVVAARDTTCAQKNDGRLYCWGSNANDETSKSGGGTVTLPHLVESTPGGSDIDWTTFATGQTSCAIKTSGALYCWGRNAEGQLGDGTTTKSPAPKLIASGTAFKLIRTGFAHTCAIAASGSLFCWGRNQAAQVKAGAAARVTTPALVDDASQWVDLALGTLHSCALDDVGRVRCWGAHGFGATGQGRFDYALVPTQVGSAKDWTSVHAYGETACARSLGGTSSCWGSTELGSLGLDSTASLAAPTPLITPLTRVAPGRQHACGIDKSDMVRCSGLGGNGQLGLGTTASASAFALIASTGKPWAGLVWSKVASSENASCAIATSGALYCWGANCYGQVDASLTSNSVTSLTKVAPALSDSWSALAAGQNHHCATRTDGSLRCWGRNIDGQIGNGKAEDGSCTIKTAPFDHGLGWSGNLAAGVNHSCAIRNDGSLWCWGGNQSGQLGDNTTVAKLAPVQIGVATDWARVAAGNRTTCATKTSGALYCWGTNGVGQLGVGDLGQRQLPALVLDSAVADVAVGFTHTCAVKTDGTLWCWGSGELGQNGLASSWSPVPSAIVEAP